MNEKQSCMSWNWNTKLFIYPMLLPIACTFIHFFQEKMFKVSNPEKSYKMLKYNVPLLFYYFLPKVFTVIIPLFLKFFSKSESQDEYKNISMRRYHSIAQHENRKKILFIIFFISFLEVVYKVDDSLLYYLKKVNIINELVEKRSGFIISVPLFSYLILNKKLFRHHIFALIIAVIGALFINCCRFPLGFSSSGDFLYHILNILFSFVFSLSLVLIKYLMTKYLISFISVNMFLFYDGLFCLLNTLICGLLEYVIVVHISDGNNTLLYGQNENYFSNNYSEIFLIFKDQDWRFYIYFLVAFVASFCYFFLNIITLYYFTPYINVLTDFMTPFFTTLLTMIFIEPDEGHNKEDRTKKYIFEFIGYAILLFGALILNEIIIFNFFGLNIDTVSTIRQRGKLDSIDFQNIIPNNNDNNDNNSEGELETEGEATSNRS